MADRHQVEARIGSRWGRHALLLEVEGGEPIRAPLPRAMEPLAERGRSVEVYLDQAGVIGGWSIPGERVGVRLHAEREPGGAGIDVLDCAGRCRTLWYLVAGGDVSPQDNCLTCGGPVAPSRSRVHDA